MLLLTIVTIKTRNDIKKSYIKKFKVKYPIGSLVKLREHKLYTQKPIESIGLILNIDYENEEVLILTSNVVFPMNIQYFRNCAKTIQRPYEKQLSAR